MYPAFKINKDFEWGMLETLTSKKWLHKFGKMRTNKKKWHNRISVTITVIMRLDLKIYKKKK